MSSSFNSTYARREMSNKINRYRRIMLSYAEGDVLETAVGTGKNFPYYNLSQISSYVGVDWSSEMLEKAFEGVDELCMAEEGIKGKEFAMLLKTGRKAKQANGPKLTLMQADCHNLPFGDNSFDTVVDTFGINHYYNADSALEEMKRVCREEGSIILIERGVSKLSLYNSYLKFRAPRDLMEFGCVEHLDIEKMVERHNFKVVYKERRNMGMTYVYILQKQA